MSGGRTEKENVYPNIHLQDALIDGSSPNRVNSANSTRSLLEEQIWMNDDEPIRSTSGEQGCGISLSSAFFFFVPPPLNHFSFARDNHVSRPSMKQKRVIHLIVAIQREYKGDQNKHLNGKRTFARRAALSNQRNVGQVVSFGD